MRRSGRVGARRLGLASGLRTVAVVVGFRLRAGWRKALSEKGKLAFGVVVCTILAMNYAFSVRAIEEAPGRDLPVDVLFGAIAFFVLLTLFQWAPLGRWFNRQRWSEVRPDGEPTRGADWSARTWLVWPCSSSC